MTEDGRRKEKKYFLKIVFSLLLSNGGHRNEKKKIETAQKSIFPNGA